MPVSRHKVLIIDDDEMVCKVLSLTLKRSGMTVLTSTNPIEGLEIVRSQPLDIVISDVRMPGMSGLELLQILRDEGILTPFVIISAQSSRDILLSSLRIGAFDFISKPMQASTISQLMDEAIRVNERQKMISLMKPTEMNAHEQALSWTLANVAPLVAFVADRLDQKTLEVLNEKDPRQRTFAAGILALHSARSNMDNLRNFQGRTWDLGVLIRIFHGLRASFEALGDTAITPHLAKLEDCFAWLRVRPEDLANDLAVTLALIGDQLSQLFKALRAGNNANALIDFQQHMTSLDARLEKIHQRNAS